MKTLPIKLLLLFSLLLVIYSCEKDDSIVKQQNNLKTVALEEAKSFLDQSLEQSKSNPEGTFINSISDNINYEAITNTDEQLVVIPVTTAYKNLYSRIVLLEIEGKLESVILSLNPFENATPSSFSGELLITDTEGKFLKGYKIENNLYLAEYVNNNSKSEYTSNFKNYLTSKDTSGSCEECVYSVCYYCQLDEVIIVVESTPPRIPAPYVSITNLYNTDGGSAETSSNEWDLGGSGSGYTDNTPEPEAEKPCPGDPVPNPEIAPQKGKSGILGGMYGCNRYGGTFSGPDDRNKKHNGVDFRNEEGSPVYAMYDGIVYSTPFDKDAGFMILIQSTLSNGQTIINIYFHLQKENGLEATTNPLNRVTAGQIIGYQGTSGNLKGAIEDGYTESHVHVETRLHDGSFRWNYDNNFNLINTKDYLATKIDENGNLIDNCK